jgi:acyl-CoA synthetase (AMP-forming)/AMP-acid ligase II
LTPFNVNYRYVPEELVYLFTDADAQACIFDAAYRTQVRAIAARLPGIKLWIEVGTPDSAHDPAHDDPAAGALPPLRPWDAVTQNPHADLFRPSWGISPDDMLFVYTGGTTGYPKGVMWRQCDLVGARAFGANPLSGIGPLASPEAAGPRAAAAQPDVLLIGPPLMHSTGYHSAINSLMNGGTVALLPSRRFDAEEIWSEAARLKAERLIIVGDTFCRPMVEALDRNPGRWDLSSLKSMVSSGTMWSAPVKAALLKHVPQLMLMDGLGSTESVGMAVSVTTIDTPVATADFQIGEHCAVFNEDGRRVQPGSGEIGRLAVSGYLPLGYHKDPKKSAAAFPVWEGQRWSCAGDLASVDADGKVHLFGRGNQCINTGGEKVYVEEVEEFLKQQPGVLDAAVLGLDDPRLGQRVCAVVTPAPGAAALPTLAGLNEGLRAHLAGYKLPRSLLVVNDLQRAASAKLRYEVLREWLRAARAKSANPALEILHWEEA